MSFLLLEKSLKVSSINFSEVVDLILSLYYNRKVHDINYATIELVCCVRREG